MILIEIPGKPIPFAHHQGYGNKAYDPRYKEKKRIRESIQGQYKGPILTDPITIEVDFFILPPASWTNKKRKQAHQGEIPHLVKPDLSNLYYLYENCLKGIVIKDDNQVIWFTASKNYFSSEKTLIKIFTDTYS